MSQYSNIQMAEFARKDNTLIPNHKLGGIPELLKREIEEIDFLLSVYEESEKSKLREEKKVLVSSLAVYEENNCG